MQRILIPLCVFLINISCSFASPKIIFYPGENVRDDVYFFDEKGEKCFLDQFENKTILLVFWATWCSSCSDEMPELDILQKDFRKLPFEIIAVSQDFLGIDAIKKYFFEKQLRHLKIYHDNKNQLFKALSTSESSLPTAFLINQDGKIKAKLTGTIKWNSKGIRDIILSNIRGDYPEPQNSHKDEPLQIIKSNQELQDKDNKNKEPEDDKNK